MKAEIRSERGQAIVLITLAMVVLLGFTALAVDGSMVYADRRHAQNTADLSSLAGVTPAADVINQNNLTVSNWNCSSSAVQAAMTAARAAAIARSGTNNATIDNDTSDGHGVQVNCVNSGAQKYLDVLVKITQETQARSQRDGLQRQESQYGRSHLARSPKDCTGVRIHDRGAEPGRLPGQPERGASSMATRW